MKITPPYDAAPGVTPERRPRAREKSFIETMTERRLCRTIYFVCGHQTDIASDDLYRVFAPSPKKHYCEKCGKWVEAKPPYKSPELPDEPLF